MSVRKAWAAEIENAIMRVWNVDETSWGGVVSLRNEGTLINFKAETAQAARNKALRLASAEAALSVTWRPTTMISPW